MALRLSAETLAGIDRDWPTILERVRAGELIVKIAPDMGYKRDYIYTYLGVRGADVRLQWEQARLDSADALYERAIEEGMRDDVTKDNAQHVRTRIDTLKWAARIRNPRLYGDKATLDVNVTKTVNLNAIIEAADRRLAQARDAIAGESQRIDEPAALLTLASIL